MTKIQVTVKPNAKNSQLFRNSDGSYMARIQSPPVDGKANKELIKLIGKEFGVAASKVTIKSGQGSRRKLIEIDLLKSN
jgi:hypothetical protein